MTHHVLNNLNTGSATCMLYQKTVSETCGPTDNNGYEK